MDNEIMAGREMLPDTLPTAPVMAMVADMARTMRNMADMVRSTNERVTELERHVRLLTKVTPAQVSQLSADIRGRAAALCGDYGLGGCEGKMGAAIRQTVKRESGITALRDLPRCEYQVAVQRVALWDDYETIKRLRQGGGRTNV